MADTLKAKETLDQLVKLFIAGDLPKTAAISVLPALNIPSSKWSLGNRILQAIAGTGDARGMKQWNEAGRSVKAGSKALCILGPSVVKDKTDPDKTHIVGFHCIPVFRAEDTHGDALPSLDPAARPVLAAVADAWGLKVYYTPFSAKFYGAYRPGAGTIQLCTHDEQVFFHELGHAAHARIAGPLKGGQDAKQEMVAEMVAVTLARVYGVQAREDQSREYVLSYADGKDLGRVLMGVLSDVQKCVDLIVKTAIETDAREMIAA